MVGAGSAGAIVATRLSEIENWKVLLLEAGGDPPIESVAPESFLSLINSRVDWGFSAYSPNACKIFGKQGCLMVRGKMLGGSSSINWMIYTRGVPEDFDEFADQFGMVGWSYADVLPYFKKFEGNQNESFVAYENGKFHSADGPVKVQSVTPTTANAAFNEAIRSAGVDFFEDVNADKYQGFYDTQSTSFNGVRSSTAQSYLDNF